VTLCVSELGGDVLLELLVYLLRDPVRPADHLVIDQLHLLIELLGLLSLLLESGHLGI
jgi:hypothetical protein